ncbi:hypothetical protein Tcan_12133 [Toxocara canis]|uniref:UPAR/Ly6 domain-containing protein n=1 Tax=Toxocara canis TaxID=6265 RepID=A0A0B2UTS4_TOXCA|nr:hypothetical protein Tcan_12133 [Toxocara canis]
MQKIIMKVTLIGTMFFSLSNAIRCWNILNGTFGETVNEERYERNCMHSTRCILLQTIEVRNVANFTGVAQYCEGVPPFVYPAAIDVATCENVKDGCRRHEVVSGIGSELISAEYRLCCCSSDLCNLASALKQYSLTALTLSLCALFFDVILRHS